jgi:hypothetical protein
VHGLNLVLDRHGTILQLKNDGVSKKWCERRFELAIRIFVEAMGGTEDVTIGNEGTGAVANRLAKRKRSVNGVPKRALSCIG